MSEFTIPTAPDGEFNFHTDLSTQANWITAAFRIARKVYADTLGWVHLRDDLPGNGSSSQGGLLFADGKRKPGFYAFMRGGLTAAQRARERKR